MVSLNLYLGFLPKGKGEGGAVQFHWNHLVYDFFVGSVTFSYVLYVCMYAFMYVIMYVSMNEHKYLYIYLHLYEYMYYSRVHIVQYSMVWYSAV